jgi:hypothetical protein
MDSDSKGATALLVFGGAGLAVILILIAIFVG